MKKTIYIETSIISYLTARPSGDLVAAAWQKVTIDWWDIQRGRFDLFISSLVTEEAMRGDKAAVAARLETLAGIPGLTITNKVIDLAELLVQVKAIPRKAMGDSLHIAVSAAYGIDYLLTWNYRHIDNAETKPIIRRICLENGYQCPEICTPLELIGVH
jgi:hypothetical protein